MTIPNYSYHIECFNYYREYDFVVEDLAFAVQWWFKYDDQMRRYGCNLLLETMFDIVYEENDREGIRFVKYLAYQMYVSDSEYDKLYKKYYERKRNAIG